MDKTPFNVAISFFLLRLCPFAIHLWTVWLCYEHWGIAWAIAALIVPVGAEVVVLVACFAWGAWYYALALASYLILRRILTALGSETYALLRSFETKIKDSAN